MKKIKYEKPISMDAGSIAAIQGLFCSVGGTASDGCRQGNSAPGGCIGGTDPQVAPVCQPGLTATFNCGNGTTNTNGNCTDGADAVGVCNIGSYAHS